MSQNAWCEALGIVPPDLDAVIGHPEANTYSLLITALLERGRPMTLLEVAERLERAGVAPWRRALLSLQRCKPARPPIYRDGDLYHLDPHDEDAGLWAFRLGLRPPAVRLVPPPPPAPIDLDAPLTDAELDHAWKDASLISTSMVRLVVAVLDAHGGPMEPADVVAAVARRTRYHGLRPTLQLQRGSPVERLPDGRWALGAHARDAVKTVREVVRARFRPARPVFDPAQREAYLQRRAQKAVELAAMSRAILVAFPPARPEAVAVADVAAREVATLIGDEVAGLSERLAGFDILGGVDIRSLLRALGVDPGERRLADLGPPQKSKQLNRAGRTLKITTELLIQGSCRIARPFGDPDKLAGYLASGELTKLRRRLESDAKALVALYEYGRLHGYVRLRWGFLDERLEAPWADGAEPKIYDFKTRGVETGAELEVVVGGAPGWEDPWSRARRVVVERVGPHGRLCMIGEEGILDDGDVQLVRVAGDPS